MKLQTNTRSKKSNFTILLAITIGVVIWGLIGAYQHYNNPSIIGKWVSRETGMTVEFTEKGTVKVDGVETGAYVISVPDIIEYNIEGHVFNMTYKVIGRSLEWGIAGEEEKFDRKGLRINI